ncbi:MAG: hypothetical protein WD471_00045 [Candidatus Paceibacterota bacterium]
MAQNQSQQLQREQASIGLPWRLMVFSMVLFFFFLLIFVGIKFGYGPYVDSEIESVDEQIIAMASEVSDDQQDQILTFQSQLSNLQTVLSHKSFSQNIFNFLEERTLPNVYFIEANYNSKDNALELFGAANSVRTFVEQLAVIEESPQVDRSIIDSMNVVEGETFFTINLFFNPEFFRQIN